jgi:glutamine synthetase
MSDTQKVLDMIKEHDAKYVDFRFTDPRGKWQHLAHHVRTITDEFLTGGVMFDGSSIAGWKAINESDMLLAPDCSTGCSTRSQRRPRSSSSATCMSR